MSPNTRAHQRGASPRRAGVGQGKLVRGRVGVATTERRSTAGDQVEVNLDENFNVIGQEADDDGPGAIDD